MAHNSPAQRRTLTPARGAFGPSAAHAYHVPRIGLRHPMERTGMSQTRTNSRIEAEYRGRTRRSAELYARARKVIPAGLTHDSRTLLPYPIYAARASGPRKWDVDGNEYVDYFGGHGALLLGHGHAAVVEAIERQVKLGTHWGASHELEVRWAASGGLHRRTARNHAQAWRSPDLRRGDHGLSMVARRRTGPLRHHARHVRAGQDRRRRPARRRGRRPRRDHGPAGRCGSQIR